ncbi:CaiB/BaiF CoA transferase family protein [Acuticoccus kandeliae]|uniref:CaiB/BaiF CoA transferase family protein n=1 Tax=Acuticoccus kandeliae TaxID=2073160 RepID=UPI000D3E02C3|nr:CoA transferase [Acuticoccus kandeliae]
MSALPLKGIRVLDLTSVVVGPLATRFFADFGADVVKVEPPEGDLMRTLGGASPSGKFSPKFLNLNRNKRSIGIDLKAPGARELMERLIASSDVVLTNMRVKALGKLGLDAESIRAKSPHIIHCAIVGFDKNGPYKDRPAYDSIIQGASGMAASNERMTGEPRYVPMTICDRIVGLVTVQLVMLALFHRERTGEGQSIEVPMLENMAEFVLNEHMGQRVFVGSDGPTGDLRILNPLAQPIPTSDGYICVTANTDKQAFALFEAIGQPELKDDPRFSSVRARLKNVQAYHSVRGEALAKRTTAEWLEILGKLDVPSLPYRTFEGLLEDEHLNAVGLFGEIEHPVEGPIRNMRMPNRFSSDWETPKRPAPALGADTRHVLDGLGYADDEIDRLAETGVVIAGKVHDAA